MSHTKELRKKLSTMTLSEMENLILTLQPQLEAEKNPMIRSSLRQRISMIRKAHVAMLAQSLNSSAHQR